MEHASLTYLVLLLPDLGNTSGIEALFWMFVVSEIGEKGSTPIAGSGAAMFGLGPGTGISSMSARGDGDIGRRVRLFQQE